MTRLVRARLGYAAGLATATGGVAVQFGSGWALILGGAAAAASFLLLADVDDEGAARDESAPPRPRP